MGKKLSITEQKRLSAHRPKETGGKKRFICLQHACHSGCKNTAKECMYAHASLGSAAGLDWTVQAQIIRLGGLKHQNAITPDQVDARVDALRKQAKAAQDEKKTAGGKTPKKAGEGAGPEEGSAASPAAPSNGGAGPGDEGAAAPHTKALGAANLPPPRASGEDPEEHQWHGPGSGARRQGVVPPGHADDREHWGLGLPVDWARQAHRMGDKDLPRGAVRATHDPRPSPWDELLTKWEVQGRFACLQGGPRPT